MDILPVVDGSAFSPDRLFVVFVLQIRPAITKISRTTTTRLNPPLG